ncbi:MAG: DUF3638 domain-containing protein, partial [Puniceicoccales bacterium]|nr:DUF3638 domain-containing protein [Puniceicoccales bacterium]
GLAKGCSEVLYKSIPALADYWQKREFQAKQVAVNLYDRLAFSAHRLTKTECNRFFSAPRNGTGQFGDNHNYVDLINLRICDSGNELKSASRAFEDKDYLRLFPLLGTSSANEITAAGKEYKFTDSGGYGDVIMIESADALKIYRKFADSQMSWRYVAPGQVGVVNLPGCFGGDDFCIWTSENGNFRICAKNNPNEILYETDNLGHLCDMNRRKQGISPYYISFLHSEEAGKIDEFSRFEGKNYTIFYYDDANEVQEVAFPRYRDSADSMLRFSRRGNDWVLSSNPNYKLINAPSFGIAGRKAVEQNLLLGYKDALWLENMAPQSAGVFKGLLPDTSILRARGITHTLYGAVSRPTYANKFFSSAKVAEVSLHANDLDFVSPCLRASDTLSQLRLAYIFQTQGEYALASQCLTNLSATGKFSPDEVNMLSRITVWIIRDVGREINGLSALVVIKALVRMLQNSPLGEDSKKILYQLIKPRGNEFPFNRLFAEYLVGIDLHPQALQLNPWEERVFWENIKMLVPTLPDIANAISVDRDQILWDIGKFPADKVDSRINDLTRLIENGREPMVRAAEKQSKQETGRSEDSMYSIFRESMAKRGIAGVDEAIKSLGAISDQPAYFFAPEPKVASVLLETISPNLFNPTATGEANLDAIAELSPVFSGDERRQFSSTGKTLTDYYNGELVEGAKQLQISQNDAVAQTIPSAEKINNLIATVNGERKIAISMAKYSAQKIEEIANANYAKATHGADAWEPLKMPNALRAYGFYISDKNGRKKALEYLKTGHPWFPTEKLDEFFGCVRNYLSGVTSGRYFDQMTKALGPVADANADESIRTNAWRDALPLLRQTRRNTSEDSELANNMLLFEYMTNIRPRADQTAKIKFIIDEISKPDCDTGALIQQIMGSGKTKVLLPFIVTLLLNRGESLPMVVSHISQLPAVAMELPAILSGVGIRMDVIDMDYSKFSNPQAIRLLREQLEVAFERRDVVPALASHTVLALNTAFLALSGNSKGEAREHRELYIEFKKLFDFCEKRGIALMDEVHLTLNPKESFIIQAPLLGQPPDRISEEDVTFIADLIHGLPDELAKEIRNNAQDQIPAATLKTQLIECVQKKYGELFNVPFELRSNFARFICGDFDGNNSSRFPSDLREFVDGISPKLKQHHVCLLRKLCSGTLPQCLTRVYGEHYGYNNKGEIVPYQNRVPTDNHFQDPHQVLCYYMLATITRGVPDVTLSNWVVKQADVAKSHAASGLPFEQTVEAKFFESLFEGIPGSKLTLLDAVDMHAEGGKTKIRPEALARMQEFLRTHATKTLALTSIFAQDQTSYTSRSYETTPVAISGLFHNTISMSGTLSNRALYPKDVRGAVDLQSGSLGKIAHKLIADEASQKTQIVTADESKLHGVGGMLDQWQTKVSSDKVENLRIIVDYAAQFKDQPVRQSVVEIANFIAHSGNGAKYIEYFDPEIKGFAIVPVDDVTRNGEKFNPKKVTNPVNDRPTNGAELFTFLDSPRTTGTDPLLMSNGHGITT